MKSLSSITERNRIFRQTCEDMKKLVVTIYGPLLRKLTIDYDESHDYDHHIAVLNNAALIMNDFMHMSHKRMKHIFIAAFVHDGIDEKYRNAEEKKVILAKKLALHNDIEDVNLMMHWISVMSYSKQVRAESSNGPTLAPSDQVAVNILRDADRIEALGEVGLRRCRQYTEAKNPEATPDEVEKMVVAHCKEKLVRLLPEGYIVTPTGCELAKPGHQVIVDFIATHEP